METEMETRIKAAGMGINLTALRGSLGELESLCNAKMEAAGRFRDAITVKAIETGILPGVLSQYVAARCSDTVKKKAQSASQLSLLFDEIA